MMMSLPLIAVWVVIFLIHDPSMLLEILVCHTNSGSCRDTADSD